MEVFVSLSRHRRHQPVPINYYTVVVIAIANEFDSSALMRGHIRAPPAGGFHNRSGGWSKNHLFWRCTWERP